MTKTENNFNWQIRPNGIGIIGYGKGRFLGIDIVIKPLLAPVRENLLQWVLVVGGVERLEGLTVYAVEAQIVAEKEAERWVPFARGEDPNLPPIVMTAGDLIEVVAPSLPEPVEHFSLVSEQKDPVGNDQPAVWDLVQEDMRARDAEGRRKYGVPLQPHNGRDVLVDAYQEALDLSVYIRAKIEEESWERKEMEKAYAIVAGAHHLGQEECAKIADLLHRCLLRKPARNAG